MANVLTGQVWSTYYQEINLQCPDVPEPLMDHFLRDASREFLRRTLMWQMLLGPMTMTANQNLYSCGLAMMEAGAIDWPVETGNAPMERLKIIRMYRTAEFGGGEIYEKTTKWLDANWPQWQLATGRIPRFFFLFDSLTQGQAIRFVPTPTDTLHYMVIIETSLSNPTVPGGAGTALNFDFNPELPFKYRREIAAGAIARLALMMNGQKPYPWTNPPLAALKQEEFEAAISKMIMKVMKDGTRMTTIAQGSRAGFA